MEKALWTAGKEMRIRETGNFQSQHNLPMSIFFDSSLSNPPEQGEVHTKPHNLIADIIYLCYT